VTISQNREQRISLNPGDQYKIAYMDSSGRYTERQIKVLRLIHRNGVPIYVKAYCSLRKENRTFRYDRILWCRKPEITFVKTPSALPSAAESKPVRRKKKKRFGKLILYAVLIYMLFYFFDINDIRIRTEEAGKSILHTLGIIPPPAPDPIPMPSPLPKPKPVPRPKPKPRPKPVTPAPKPVPKPAPKPKNLIPVQKHTADAVRGSLFTVRTGITSSKVLDLYRNADTDRDNRLSWEELADFQKKLTEKYSYIENETALRPDEFLTSGGGDCEDFALVTAGLVIFWGGEAYIGCFSPPGNRNGHAVCMIYVPDIPGDFQYYYLYGSPAAESGEPIPAKYYVPVDYQEVGGLSDPETKDWELNSMYIPENMYGLRL
jgi:hypothetical protein